MQIDPSAIDPDAAKVIQRLRRYDHAAYLVGGCVRDALLHLEPKDWDVATNALPADIQKRFRRSLYTNRFGTVIVQTPEREVEVTTYRLESEYSDHRHPDAVAFTHSLYEDLARRDFTINAMAWDGRLRDPHAGARDLRDRLIRAVGDPNERVAHIVGDTLRSADFTAVQDADDETFLGSRAEVMVVCLNLELESGLEQRVHEALKMPFAFPGTSWLSSEAGQAGVRPLRRTEALPSPPATVCLPGFG